MSLLWVTASDRSGEYHQGVFYLPTHVIEHYDLPDIEEPWHEPSGGDEGWSWGDLASSIREHGIQHPIEVGKSHAQMAAGDHRPYAFNGNHRLMLARRGHLLSHVPCVHSSADDAEPLTQDEIKALGGWVES